ncbi:MarR family winged helix-turn-helix transcriptional regulator [Allokutzneria oryzae]|uniref:MarR family winged helix-turn-helix transcriptional regulator n=1 Tax=Allokutzneria oryzae TaxID=1378989 RepID=A0ABV5ZSU3_9PSEU
MTAVRVRTAYPSARRGGRHGPVGNGPDAAAGVDTALADVVARLRRAMRRAARGADPGNTLSVAQLELLSCLAEHPGARPGQLARMLKLAPNSVTTLANGLRARGLISRSSGCADRRTVHLTLTEPGTDAVTRWHSVNVAVLSAAVDTLHPGWQHLLAAALPALSELAGAIDDLAERGADGPPT